MAAIWGSYYANIKIERKYATTTQSQEAWNLMKEPEDAGKYEKL